MNARGYVHIFSLLIAAILLIAGGWYAHVWYLHNFDKHKLRRVTAVGFRYTSPLLDVELPEGFKINREPIPFMKWVSDS